MEQALEQRRRESLGDLPPEDVHAIVAFAQFLSERRRNGPMRGGASLSVAGPVRLNMPTLFSATGNT